MAAAEGAMLSEALLAFSILCANFSNCSAESYNIIFQYLTGRYPPGAAPGSSLAAADRGKLNVAQIANVSALGASENVYEIVVANGGVPPAGGSELMTVKEKSTYLATRGEWSELNIVEVVTLSRITS
jgi:hypothetical protein